jgi:hypothetical protein
MNALPLSVAQQSVGKHAAARTHSIPLFFIAKVLTRAHTKRAMISAHTIAASLSGGAFFFLPVASTPISNVQLFFIILSLSLVTH